MLFKDKTNFYEDYSKIGKNCVSCGQYSHQLKDCSRVHFIPDKYMILRKNEQNQFSERQKHIRKGVSLYKALKDYQELNKMAIAAYLGQANENDSIFDDLSSIFNQNEESRR